MKLYLAENAIKYFTQNIQLLNPQGAKKGRWIASCIEAT
jgi:hypothetical protein